MEKVYRELIRSIIHKTSNEHKVLRNKLLRNFIRDSLTTAKQLNWYFGVDNMLIEWPPIPLGEFNTGMTHEVYTLFMKFA